MYRFTTQADVFLFVGEPTQPNPSPQWNEEVGVVWSLLTTQFSLHFSFLSSTFFRYAPRHISFSSHFFGSGHRKDFKPPHLLVSGIIAPTQGGLVLVTSSLYLKRAWVRHTRWCAVLPVSHLDLRWNLGRRHGRDWHPECHGLWPALKCCERGMSNFC